MQDVRSVLILWGLQCCGVWLLVAYGSKQLVVDALIFDLLIVVAFFTTLFWMGAAGELTFRQSVGVAMMLVGLILCKICGHDYG